MDLCMMKGCSMFYNGKAKPCSASLPGMAFVHPVKTLKDPALFTFRNADSIVYHTVKRISLTVSDHDTHMTILFCIAHRIIRNVKKHLIQHMTDTLDLLSAG